MSTLILLNEKLHNAITLEDKDNKNSDSKKKTHISSLKNIGINEVEAYYDLLLKKMNEKYPKYKINNIKFVSDPIPFIKTSPINAGMIVKQIEEEYIPLAYIFLSMPKLGSRNIFGAQQLFPGLSYLVKEFINSPSFTLANLPIYFVNGSTDYVTESMQETITAINLMDVGYVQLFDEESLPQKLFKSNLIQYSKFISNDEIDTSKKVITTDFYNLDFENKKLIFRADYLVKAANSSFGSSDRFFVIKSYPAVILADEMKYTIDISEIKSFIEDYSYGKNNIMPFIDYTEKLKKRERL
ncbi:hypothetical protein [Mammaliicoccus sciuri]|uniref:hypothetical protein n=1 Tax=Mammaliicoccus sciuri TaxID=1296 RepID=UPI003A90B962